jgi:hypothetical protein
VTDPNLQRLLQGGFSDTQAAAILDVVRSAAATLVTREYFDQRLRQELQRQKRSVLLWTLVMQAPVYAALIYLTMKVS